MARNTPQLHVNRSSPAANRKEKKKRAGLRQPGPKPVTENGPLMPEGPSRCSASLRAARSNRTASAAWSPNKSADRPNPSHFLPLPPHFSLAKRAAVPRPLEARRPWRRGGCARRRSVQRGDVGFRSNFKKFPTHTQDHVMHSNEGRVLSTYPTQTDCGSDDTT